MSHAEAAQARMQPDMKKTKKTTKARRKSALAPAICYLPAPTVQYVSRLLADAAFYYIVRGKALESERAQRASDLMAGFAHAAIATKRQRTDNTQT